LSVLDIAVNCMQAREAERDERKLLMQNTQSN